MKHCLKSLFSLIVILISIRCSTPSEENEDRPPNILVIMADDMGYSDLGCYGSEIATPFIMHWPAGTQRSGELETDYAHIVDIMATCVDVAGATYPETYAENEIKPMRGQSLRWALEGENRSAIPTLYWEHFGHKAVRQGQWKLVSAPPDNQWELYNLEQDPAELNDLSQQNSEQTEEMATLYQQWADEVGVK